MSTIYEYNQKELYHDDNDSYTPEEIQAHYAQHFPELNQATYTVIPPKTDQEARKIIFAKKVGTKGQNEVVKRLLTVKPTELKGITLLQKLYANGRQPTSDQLLILGPEIEQALQHTEAIAEASQRIVKRCLTLPAIPLNQIPFGF